MLCNHATLVRCALIYGYTDMKHKSFALLEILSNIFFMCLRSCMVFLSPPRNCQDSILSYATTDSCHVFYNLVLTNIQPLNDECTLETVIVSLNKLMHALNKMNAFVVVSWRNFEMRTLISLERQRKAFSRPSRWSRPMCSGWPVAIMR
jgi:hypothetical protein